MNPVRFRFAAIFFCAVLFLVSCAAASSFSDSSCPSSFAMQGSVYMPDSASWTVTSGDSSETIWLPYGTVLTITGGEGGRYSAVLDAQNGWIPKGCLLLSGIPGEEAEEALCDTLMPDTLFPTKGEYSCIAFSGEIHAPEPVSSLELFLWDERKLNVEKAWFIQLQEPSDTVSASVLADLIPVNSLTGGRKTLVIQGNSSNRQYTLSRIPLIVRGKAQEPSHITDLCENVPYTLSDYNLETFWRPNDSMPSVTIGIPEGSDAALMTLEWIVPPDSWTVTLTGRDGQILSESVNRTGFLLDSVELTEQVASICITPAGENCRLATLRVYPSQYAKHAVQRWESLPDKVDLMLFSAHQDDELLFFGGMIPYYSALGKTVAVTYMTNCGRDRYAEALDGMWTVGLKYHPVFVGWRDAMVTSKEVAQSLWLKNTPDPLLDLVRLIRKYRPEVVVTHDFNGEYGHLQHVLTAELVSEAAVLAGDASYDPETQPWKVKKVYIHLYEENQIIMDWDQPLPGNESFTSLELATEGYDKHDSQRRFFSMEKHGILYDNQCFGLYYSAVGEDLEKNDLFENVSDEYFVVQPED